MNVIFKWCFLSEALKERPELETGSVMGKDFKTPLVTRTTRRGGIKL